MEITFSLALIGLGTSIINEIIKLVPFVRENDAIKSLVAIIVVAVLAFLTNGFEWSWINFYGVMGFAFLNYKMIVQPVATTLRLASQPDA